MKSKPSAPQDATLALHLRIMRAEMLKGVPPAEALMLLTKLKGRQEESDRTPDAA
jgi:hypothetical protein